MSAFEVTLSQLIQKAALSLLEQVFWKMFHVVGGTRTLDLVKPGLSGPATVNSV